MKLTIEMSNRNKDWFLDRSIYLLSKQTLPQDEWELIIVDDGSTDQSDDVIQRYKKMNIIKNFKYIKNTGKSYDHPSSPAKMSRMVIKESYGDYIIHTDPGIMPFPNWAEKHYLAHDGKTDRCVLGNCICPKELHVITDENQKQYPGAFLGNAYTDYDWFKIENVWKIMNEKIQKIQTNFNLNGNVINKEFFNDWQAGFSLSRKLMFDLRECEENLYKKSIEDNIYNGDDITFETCLNKLNSKKIIDPNIKAIRICLSKDNRNGASYEYIHNYTKDYPEQKQTNKELGFMEVLHNTELVDRSLLERDQNKLNIIKDVFKYIESLISERDGLFLYELASKCKRGVIVEIGSAGGASTTCLAKGSKSGHNAKIYSVDPHIEHVCTMDPEYSLPESEGISEGIPDIKYYINQGITFPQFKEALQKMNVENIVTPIVDYSELAYINGIGKEWDIPIELLFIDGDHRYNYVKKDLELWGKWVINGGLILLHDRPFPGVIKVIANMIMNNPRYSEIRDIDRSPIFNMLVR